MDSKPWYASKTIWLNLASGVLAAVAETFGALPPDAAGAGWVVTALNAANIFLRFLTTNAVRA